MINPPAPVDVSKMTPQQAFFAGRSYEAAMAHFLEEKRRANLRDISNDPTYVGPGAVVECVELLDKLTAATK